MDNLTGVVRLLKKEQDRLTTELRGIGAALAAFGHAYAKGTGTRRLSAAARARHRGRPKGALGKIPGNDEGCACSWQTDPLSCDAEEDCSCAKGEMGEGESGEENCLGSSALDPWFDRLWWKDLRKAGFLRLKFVLHAVS